MTNCLINSKKFRGQPFNKRSNLLFLASKSANLATLPMTLALNRLAQNT